MLGRFTPTVNRKLPYRMLQIAHQYGMRAVVRGMFLVGRGEEQWTSVRAQFVDGKGRPHFLDLTPDEARRLAQELVEVAEDVTLTRAHHGGDPPPVTPYGDYDDTQLTLG